MPSLDLSLFGARLKAARRGQGLTQAQLAVCLDAWHGWISELENAKQGAIQANTVYRLCQALGCSADYLLGLTDTPAGRSTPRRPPPQ